MEDFSRFVQRKSTRLPEFDYSSAKYYFVTICSAEKKCIFGLPDCLNERGMIAKTEMDHLGSHYNGVKVDNFVIMPNHIHAILVIEKTSATTTLNSIVGSYKSGVSRRIRDKEPEMCVWQRSFHDHIIRGQSDYEKIWNYVTYNPNKWEADRFYSPTCKL